MRLTGFRTATTQIDVEAGDVLSVVARMAADGVQAAEESRFEVVDRHRSWYGTVFNKDQLLHLPATDSVWSLIETADPLTITDRIDGGGISSGDRTLIGSHASSWTQASYHLGDLDVTDLGRPGTPLLYRISRWFAISAWIGLDANRGRTSGTAVTLVPGDRAGRSPVRCRRMSPRPSSRVTLTVHPTLRPELLGSRQRLVSGPLSPESLACSSRARGRDRIMTPR